jgi:hypothetical protein
VTFTALNLELESTTLSLDSLNGLRKKEVTGELSFVVGNRSVLYINGCVENPENDPSENDLQLQSLTWTT